MKRVLLVLGLPPVVFLVVIVAASAYYAAATGADAAAIAERVAGSAPYLLLIVEAVLLAVLMIALRAEGTSLAELGWRPGTGQAMWREVLVGAAPGLVLALLYVTWLSPLLAAVQRALGDYVPPGELLPSLSGAVLPFFIANVVLAPFVEESIYRGYGLARLRKRFALPVAIALSCVFFGLLHWAGGFWYVVLTGTLAGGLFAGLFVWRNNIIAPYAAHLTLNLVEFAYVWLWVAR